MNTTENTQTATTVLMGISPHQGYAPDQIERPMTLGELAAQLQDAIAEWGEDAQIVTIDATNRYGAAFGSIDSWGTTFTDADPDTDY